MWPDHFKRTSGLAKGGAGHLQWRGSGFVVNPL